MFLAPLLDGIPREIAALGDYKAVARRRLNGNTWASLDALPAIAERLAGRGQILLDGGIRRGSDIFEAIALGAPDRTPLHSRPCSGQP